MWGDVQLNVGPDSEAATTIVCVRSRPQGCQRQLLDRHKSIEKARTAESLPRGDGSEYELGGKDFKFQVLTQTGC